MIQIYADGSLVYDSQLEGYELLGLTITTGLNVGGTATLVLPLNHPAYDRFVARRTIVTIYRDGELRFRGRVLYPAETYYGQRTILCEGEMCLLGDGTHRPYKYVDTPANVFAAVIRNYNEQMENYDFKHFEVGEVTASHPEGKITLENTGAETHQSIINKLLESCGGYIVFSDGENGTRRINWYAALENRSGQVIEFGENLLDFTSTGANNSTFATTVIPYGAMNSTTKKRTTIESVNGGKDYVTDEDAKALYGNIVVAVTWEDVTSPTALLQKAQAYLDTCKQLITSLELTALDLSLLDKNIDSLVVGDLFRVLSLPHRVDDFFQLTQMTEDLLNPAQSRIILGKDVPSLTRADVAGDSKSHNEMEAVRVQVQDPELTGYVKTEDLEGYAKQDDLTGYAKTEDLANLATTEQVNTTVDSKVVPLQDVLNKEVSDRAGVINKVDGVVHISGGAPINMLGGKVDISGTEINFGKEARFLNESGIRIADKDGNFYYTLRVDSSNVCVVGNDYTNLYLRGKDAVYLYKTGAVVTSDQRHKNSAEGLPDAYMAMLDKLTPMRFRYNDRGDKYHVGFIAQDVEKALADAGLTAEDFGGFADLNGDGTELGLVYDEFIGLLLEKIRRLEKRLDKMEGKA